MPRRCWRMIFRGSIRMLRRGRAAKSRTISPLGLRRADEDCRAVLVANRYYGDDDAGEAGAIAGAPRAAAGLAARGGEGIARSGIACRCLRVALGAGDYGWRRRTRSRRGSRERSGSAVVFFGRLVLDAFVGEAVLAVCAGEISAAGEAV